MPFQPTLLALFLTLLLHALGTASASDSHQKHLNLHHEQDSPSPAMAAHSTAKNGMYLLITFRDTPFTNTHTVLKQPLQFLSLSPPTGFLRTGYCETPAADFGNHAVAAEVTEEFLDFSAARGNDLRVAGLTGGCKWCLCASRWKEAFEARTGATDAKVPKVFLGATNESALKKVELGELRGFAKDA